MLVVLVNDQGIARTQCAPNAEHLVLRQIPRISFVSAPVDLVDEAGIRIENDNERRPIWFQEVVTRPIENLRSICCPAVKDRQHVELVHLRHAAQMVGQPFARGVRSRNAVV